MGHVHPGPQHHRVVGEVRLVVEPPERPAEQGLRARRRSRGVGEDRFLDEAGDVVVQVPADPYPSDLHGRRDDRADVRGVFIFRMEERDVLPEDLAGTARTTIAGRVPVIYRLDLSDGSSLFAAQDFQIEDRDVIYVSSAPAADLQRFMSALSNVAFSTIAISNALQQ